MIISNSHRFIFVHILKAAGTSITRGLDKSLQWNDLVLGATPLGEQIQDLYRERFHLHKHSFAKEIKEVVGEEIWSEWFSFTFVRHPYDRAISVYTFIEGLVQNSQIRRYRRYFSFKRRPRKPFWNWAGTRAFLKTKSFSEFIRSEDLLASGQTMKPQTDWILDEKGKIMVDFVGKVENINKDFAFICNNIGLEYIELEIHNQSRMKKRNNYLNQKNDYDYLYNLFRKDFDILGYDPNPDSWKQT